MRGHRELLTITAVAVVVAVQSALPAGETAVTRLAQLVHWTTSNATPGAPSGFVKLYGNFSDGDQVTADGAALPTKFVSSYELRASFTAHQLASPGTYELRVSNGSGQTAPTQLHVSSQRFGVVLGSSDLSVPAVPTAIGTALLNADLRRDLIYITGGSTPRLWTAMANAGGGFAPAVAVNLLNAPTSFAVGDVDNDNDDDVIALQGGAGNASVLRNDGNGGFTVLDEVATGHSTAPAVATGDFNGDGRLDFVVANTNEGTVRLHLASDGNAWSSETAVASVTTVAYPAVADIDHDGDLDLLAISATTGALIRYLGDGNGALGAGVNIPVTAGSNALMVVGDVNDDGSADIVTARLNATNFSPEILRLNGAANGTFAAAATIPHPTSPLLTAMAFVDINADHQIDIVGVDSFSSVHFLRGDNTGNFPYWTSVDLGFRVARFAAADLDDDGYVDLVAGGQKTNVFPIENKLTVLQHLDPGPLPRLVIRDATVTETDGTSTVSIPVYLVDANGQPTFSTVPFDITLAFQDGTATIGNDYRAATAPSFPVDAYVTESTVQLRLVGNIQFEPTETFSIQISTTSDAVEIADGTAIITINDNDPAPLLADISGALTITEVVRPGESFSGLAAITNHGPGPASNAGVVLRFVDPTQVTNLQAPTSTFQITAPNNSQGTISGGMFTLAAGQGASLTFSATPTAAARNSEDFVAIAEELGNPVEVVQPNGVRNLEGSPGRKGLAFAQDGDDKVNDLLFYDPGPNLLRVVNNVDAVDSQSHTIDVAAAYPGYIVADMDVCPLSGSSVPSAVLSLVRHPGITGDRSIVVTHELPSADPTAAPFRSLFSNLADKTVTDVQCVDLNNDSSNDVAVLYHGSGGILMALTYAAADIEIIVIPLYSAVSLASDFGGGDFDRNGINDIAVIEQATGQVLVLLNPATNSTEPVVSAINLQDLFGAKVIGGEAFDPVTNSKTPVDYNGDGSPDLAIVCTSCAPGGAPAIVPLLNLGGTAPGSFHAQSPIPLRDATDTSPRGELGVMGHSRNGEGIFVGRGDGHLVRLQNTTAPGANTVTFDVTSSRQCGSGPSSVATANLFNDTARDLFMTDCAGRVVTDFVASSATGDPDGTNNGAGKRILRLVPEAPNSFELNPDGRIWIPGAVAVLRNTAVDKVLNSLTGARVYASDQDGHTVDFKVLQTTDDKVSLLWPTIPREFTEPDAQITVFAETAGGFGISSTRPLFPETGFPSVSVQDLSVAEDNSNDQNRIVNVTLLLDRPSNEPVIVQVFTVDDTALHQSDYGAVARTVVIPAGEITARVEIEVFRDHTDEPDESFFLEIGSVQGAAVNRRRGVVTVVDNDEEPQLVLSNVSAPEGNAPTTTVSVTASLVGAVGAPNAGQATTSGKPVTLAVSTTNQTAVLDVDFTVRPMTVTISPNVTSATIPVELHGDTIYSSDKTFLINLVVTNAIIPASSVFTIVNDDPKPTVSIDDVTVVENPKLASDATFTLTLSAPSEEPVSVTVTTADGTAFGGFDYQESTRTVTFPPGVTTMTFIVAVNVDPQDEPDENFFLNLSNAVGARIGDGQGLAVIVDDDPTPDTEPPTIASHVNITALAESAAGAQVAYELPSVSDNTGVASLECIPPSGSTFPIGTTTVTCTARDVNGNTARSSFSVAVKTGQPSIATRIINQGATAPGSGIHYFDVEVQNKGTGHASALSLNAFKFRVLSGVGSVALNALTGPLPQILGDLRVGEARVVRVFADVAATVSRMSLTTTGTVRNVLDASPKNFSVGSAVVISR